ncbi:hypothetical protein ACIPSE_32550 [Streptomyces sp. NPDC090106]|uniref:hypothetical protein n=1 Tax=Streptomyces sp. NPDC090106 TaxID=3365946 RepID=UPI00381725CF
MSAVPEQRLIVDTDGLEHAAAVLRPVAERLRVLAAGVGRQLAALGDPAGDDVFGARFKGKHDPQAALVREGARGVGVAVTDAGDGLTKMAALFEAAEHGAQRTTARLNTQLGQGGNSGGGGRR